MAGNINAKQNRKKKVEKLFQNKRKWSKDKVVVQKLIEEISKIPEHSSVDNSQIKRFLDLPISQKTLIGLKDAGYVQPTEIQKESLPSALKGLDIVGAAMTGSGKTLAFLIPVIELLYRNEWTKLDRLGALIITPTRELALQIFEVLRKIGKKHDFSAGLVIGGKDLQFERPRLANCNIIICTPGRILQHMNENPYFDCINLKILVLDEADKIMEQVFENTMNDIIENLPVERQTLLFSATQTKKVKDLTRLSMKDPVYVSTNENSISCTPDLLRQGYVICELHDKFNLLWSFIKCNLKKKILVFMATCKQVKYSFEALCHLRPGVSVMALHGKMHQQKRMDIYNEFCNKRHAVLIATDVAARGLDFPHVNWVVQLDCPEDAVTYIHRVGRTARYDSKGQALLVLLPSETKMATYITDKRIPIGEIKVDPEKQRNVQKNLEVFLAKFLEMKDSAKRAFVAYMKSVYLMKDKSVFDVTKIDTEAYSRSLGLATAPRLRFIKRQEAKKKITVVQNDKAVIGNNNNSDEEEDDDDDDEVASVNDDKESSSKSSLKSSKEAYNFYCESESDEEDSLLTLKKRHLYNEEEGQEKEKKTNNENTKNVITKAVVAKEILKEEKTDDGNKKNVPGKVITKAAAAKKILRKNIKPNVKIYFGDDGEVLGNVPRSQVSELAKSSDLMGEKVFDIEKAKQIMREEDKIDKEIYRQRLKAARQAKKILEKEKMRKKRNEEQEDDFADEEAKKDDWSSGDEESVDLDFLPDPDKIYGKGKETSDNSDDNDDSEKNEGEISEEESSENDEQEELTNKRKRISFTNAPNKKRQLDKETIQSIASDLSLQDTESLAQRLLGFS